MPQVGKYELIRKLATGGMAEVFLAKAAGPMGFEKTLVVKRILPHLLEEPQFVEMFLSEAKLAARLNHQNIVQIFDFGEADGAYFIAMEYIAGTNLRTLARRAYEQGSPLLVPLCAKIVSFTCEGLAYAHELVDEQTGEALNIIHRDISPDNILITRNGGVKVVDFGIAKAATQMHRTGTGVLKGKLAYMAPEQLQKKPMDLRADVYALGVVLYELVTGQKPHDADSEITLMMAIVADPIIAPKERRPDLPDEVERIIKVALDKDPAKRFPSCRELQAALERYLRTCDDIVGPYEIARAVEKLAALPAGGGQSPPVRGSGPKPSLQTPSAPVTTPIRVSPPAKATPAPGTQGPPAVLPAEAPSPAEKTKRWEEQPAPAPAAAPRAASQLQRNHEPKPAQRGLSLTSKAVAVAALLLLVGGGGYLGLRGKGGATASSQATPPVKSPEPAVATPRMPPPVNKLVEPEPAPKAIPPAEPPTRAENGSSKREPPPAPEKPSLPKKNVVAEKPKPSKPVVVASQRVTVEKGHLKFRVRPPDTTVILDGKNLSQDDDEPIPDQEVPIGLHEIKLVNSAQHKEYKLNCTVSSDEDTTVKADLAKDAPPVCIP